MRVGLELSMAAPMAGSGAHRHCSVEGIHWHQTVGLEWERPAGEREGGSPALEVGSGWWGCGMPSKAAMAMALVCILSLAQ